MPPKPRRLLLAVVVAAIACSACGPPPVPQPSATSSAPSSPPPDSSRALPTVGSPLERAIAPEAQHRYRAELEAGTFLHVVVEQRQTDVVLSVEGPDGTTIQIADGPTAGLGREMVAIVARVSGAHHVLVHAFPGPAVGHYALRVEAREPATPEQRIQAHAATALGAGERFADEGDLDAAISAYREALDHWRRVAQRWGVATALHRLALAEHRRHQFDATVEAATEAAVLFEALEASAMAAMCWHAVGRGHYLNGNLSDAVAAYQRASPLRTRAGDRHGEAITAINLGLAHRHLGQPHEALSAYHYALARLEPLDRPSTTATAFHNLGTLYRARGDHDRARDRLADALRLRRKLRDPRRTAATLDQLGRVAEATGDDAAARRWFEQGLERAVAADDDYARAVIETRLGRLWQRQGQLERARGAFEHALRVMRARNDRRAEAQILQLLGTLEIDRQHPADAIGRLHTALALHRDHGELASEAETWIAIARAEQQLNRLDHAWSAARAARAIVESVRGRVLLDIQRARYAATATVRNVHALEIDLAMARHARDPRSGWDARALAANEGALARWLLDLVAATGAELRSGIDPELLARERALLEALSARAHLREALRDERAPPSVVQTADRRFRDTLEELTTVRGAIHELGADHPTGRLGSPMPRTLDALRAQLLDPNTVLVEIGLSEPVSHLWVLRHDGLHSFTLAGRLEIEALARRAYSQLQHARHREGRAASQATLCQLSARLLGPAVDVLGGHRLLIVAGGALQTLPFAALPHPAGLADCRAAPPLIASHEIIHLPSASVAAVLRERRATRPRAQRGAAVIADPVTSRDDPRLPRRPNARDPQTSPSFRRLPHAGREVAAIQGRMRPDEAWVISGFDANRDTLQRNRLSDYGLIHFATHAVLDPEQPGMAGILLSTFARDGRPLDGWLRPQEIYNLDLNTNLVVLSACQTGLGEAIAGEGLVGLTYGFFHAGATQLLVSLWPVDDQATAHLMDAFYQALLVEQQPASAALRHAQRALRARAAWSAPYHWAGFVLQGDWR